MVAGINLLIVSKVDLLIAMQPQSLQVCNVLLLKLLLVNKQSQYSSPRQQGCYLHLLDLDTEIFSGSSEHLKYLHSSR